LRARSVNGTANTRIAEAVGQALPGSSKSGMILSSVQGRIYSESRKGLTDGRLPRNRGTHRIQTVKRERRDKC